MMEREDRHGISRGFDPYMLAGMSILGVAALVLLLLMIQSWRTIFSMQSIYYSVALLVVILTPVALLAFAMLVERGSISLARLSIPVIRRKEVSSRVSEKNEERSIEGVAKAIDIPSVITNSGVTGIKEVNVSPVNINKKASETPNEARNQIDTFQEKVDARSSESIKEDVSILVREEISKAISDIISKVGKISEEMDSIKRGFEETKAMIEGGMMDIRTLLSEISNPFNYMRRFISEPELREVGITQEKTSKRGEPAAVDKELVDSSNMVSSKSVSRASEAMAETPTRSAGNNVKEDLAELLSERPSIAKIMKLVLFVGENLPKIGREGILGLVELGVVSSILPHDSMHLVARIISLIESSKVPPKRLAITIYELARSVGVYEREAEFLATALSGG
ncbi:MAG: hypothetical protein RQ885_08005 [Desulfurococcales archaeon]|jgi:hypothetical protein|nr:hypothetical protein [Desulfurococcales archaeon]